MKTAVEPQQGNWYRLLVAGRKSPPRGVVLVEHLGSKDREHARKAMVEAFRDHCPESVIDPHTEAHTDWSLSRKLTVGGETVGYYLLGRRQLLDYLRHRSDFKVKADLDWYKGKRGVEGVGLVVLPEYRGLGYGRQLKDMSRRLGFDYMWGVAFKSLHNLSHWLKRRQLVAEGPGVYVTAEKF